MPKKALKWVVIIKYLVITCKGQAQTEILCNLSYVICNLTGFNQKEIKVLAFNL